MWLFEEPYDVNKPMRSESIGWKNLPDPVLGLALTTLELTATILLGATGAEGATLTRIIISKAHIKF